MRGVPRGKKKKAGKIVGCECLADVGFFARLRVVWSFLLLPYLLIVGRELLG